MRLLSYIIGVSAVISYRDVLSWSRTITILPKVDGLKAPNAQNLRLLPNDTPADTFATAKDESMHAAARLLLPWGVTGACCDTKHASTNGAGPDAVPSPVSFFDPTSVLHRRVHRLVLIYIIYIYRHVRCW